MASVCARSLAIVGLVCASSLAAAQAATLLRVPQAIADRYIVVFKPSATAQVTSGNEHPAAELTRQLQRDYSLAIEHRFTYAIDGFSTSASPGQLAALLADPRVETVEQDGLVSTSATQTNPPWGLDRSDQRALPLSASYTQDGLGNGVRVYIVDTGIRADHVDFAGRVEPGFTAIDDGNGSNDCHGHGTHVAGTVGGSSFGIAKAVSLVPVRVLACSGSGSTSSVIAGLDWIRANQGEQPAVANLSLSGGVSPSLDAAVQNAVAAGVVVVVAAGNNAIDACNYSPSRAPSAVTVGATDRFDQRASFSNFGACLDLFAPGSGVLSAWHSSTTASASLSGTSMAAPHVAGAADLLRAARPTASAADIVLELLSSTSEALVVDARSGSPNRLLFVPQTMLFGTGFESP